MALSDIKILDTLNADMELDSEEEKVEQVIKNLEEELDWRDYIDQEVKE